MFKIKTSTSLKFSAVLLSTILCSVGYGGKTSLSDGSFFDLETLTYQPNPTADPKPISFFLEVNSTGKGSPKNAKLLLDSSEQPDGYIKRTFLGQGNIKFTELFTSTPKNVTDGLLQFTACTFESKSFFSQWKNKIEHNPRTFESKGFYEMHAQEAGDEKSIFYRIFEPTKIISKYSKPASDGCPADFGRLPGVGDNYDSDSGYTDVVNFFN